MYWQSYVLVDQCGRRNCVNEDIKDGTYKLADQFSFSFPFLLCQTSGKYNGTYLSDQQDLISYSCQARIVTPPPLPNLSIYYRKKKGKKTPQLFLFFFCLQSFSIKVYFKKKKNKGKKNSLFPLNAPYFHHQNQHQ